MCPHLLFYTFYLCWLYVFALWVQMFSYIQKPKENQAPCWTCNCSSNYFFVSNFLLLVTFQTRCFGTLWRISSLLPPFALLQSLQPLFSAMHGYCRVSRYTLLFLSVIQEAEPTNSRAASKWRIYSCQANSNHASAPRPRLQQLFLLRAVGTHLHSFSWLLDFFIEAATTPKTLLRRMARTFRSHSNWMKKTSCQHRSDHQL